MRAAVRVGSAVAAVLLAAGCGGSSGGAAGAAASLGTTSAAPSPSPSPSPSPTTTSLAGTHTVAFDWAASPAPETCPAGASKTCFHITGSASDPLVGNVNLDEHLVIDGTSGCAPGVDKGTVGDGDSNQFDFSATGQFCFAGPSFDAAIIVTGGKGTFTGASGKGTAKVGPQGDRLTDKWQLTLTVPS